MKGILEQSIKDIQHCPKNAVDGSVRRRDDIQTLRTLGDDGEDIQVTCQGFNEDSTGVDRDTGDIKWDMTWVQQGHREYTAEIWQGNNKVTFMT